MIGFFGEIDRLQKFVDEADRKPDRDDDERGEHRAEEAGPGFRARIVSAAFPWRRRARHFPRGSQLVHDGALRRPAGAR